MTITTIGAGAIGGLAGAFMTRAATPDRTRPSETRSSRGKLIAYGRKAGAGTRLNARLFEMIDEIEDGRRPLGFHNVLELEAHAASIGKTLP